MRLWMTVCLLVASGLPATAAVVREPYLQMVTPTSITIVWQTDLNSANNSRVQYGTVAGILNQTAFGTAVIPPSNAAVKNHVVTIAGLSPATKYFYNVGTVTNGVQGGGTTNHFLVTAPSVGTSPPFRAWVLGDSGWNLGSADQEAVRDAMLNETGLNPPSPDIILHAGDIAYTDGTDPEFTTNHFAIYQNILRHTPLWPTLGNHDSFSANSALGLGPYYEAHVLPTGGEAGGVASGTEAYYSFDYANVHFIVLDSMESTQGPALATMLTWLQNDLAATSQEWVIAYFHHPPYTKGNHNSDDALDSGGRLVLMRETVLPILEAGLVDLVIAGHSHIYERSYPLRGAYGYGTFPNFATPNFGTLLSSGNILDTGDGNPLGTGAYENGTVYIVSGTGGGPVSAPFGGAHPVMFFSEAHFASVLLDINGPILRVQNVRSTGAITDTFSIDKSSLAEIVWRNTADGSVVVWLMNGLTIDPSSGTPGGLPTTWNIADIGDLNGDGKVDLVWRNMNTGEVAGWLMNGSSIITTGVIAGAVSADWGIAGVGDLDGDGKDDIVWRNTTDGAVVVWLMDGLTIGPAAGIGGAPMTWTIAGIGDVDGDGKADLVWRETNAGDVGVWLMNGLSVLTTGVVAGGVPATWVIAGIGDVDGGGKADLVWRETNAGDVGAWLMNGLSTPTTAVVAAAVPAAWVIADVGDLNGDGKADLVWRETNSGDVGAWLMNGLSTPTTGVIAGSVPLVWEIQ